MIAYLPGSRNGLDDIATSYGMEGFGVRIPAEARYFLFSKSVQTGSGAHPASFSEYGGSFSGSKAAGA